MVEDIFFRSTHGKFTKINYMLDHKSSLDKFKRTQMLETIYSNYYATELETTTVIVTTSIITISTTVVVVVVVLTNTMKIKKSIQCNIFGNLVIHFRPTQGVKKSLWNLEDILKGCLGGLVV